MYQRDEGICHICGTKVEYPGKRNAKSRFKATLDHIIPRSQGGDHSTDNLKLAHRICNNARGTLPVPLSDVDRKKIYDYIKRRNNTIIRDSILCSGLRFKKGHMDLERSDEERKALWEQKVIETKQFRSDCNKILGRMKDVISDSPNRSLAIRHLEDCQMRLGVQLGELHQENPYPSSYDPSNAKVEPTAPEVSNIPRPIRFK